MKKTLFTFLTVAVCLTMAVAQVPGESMTLNDELKMESWPGDKLAEAGVIYDKGIVKFVLNNADSGFDIHFSRATKIKIFNEAGIKYATVEIPLYYSNGEQERVERIKGVVYNMEGGMPKATHFDPKLVYEEKINNNWKVKKFALPNVKAGSVVEYSYLVITPFVFNLPDWEFQWDIPVKLSKLTAAIVPFYEYMFLFQGAKKFDRQVSGPSNDEQRLGSATYKEMIHDFELHNVPAFRDEDFITSRKDFIKKIDFQLTNTTNIYGTKTRVMTTWKELCKDMMNEERFGKFIAAAKRDCKQTAVFDASLDTTANFLNAINAVKNQYNWDKRYNFLASKSVKEFTSQKTGTSSEINLYAIGMLNAMGIDALPLLISTRSHGRIISDYPFINAFNHVLICALIEGNYVIADATDPYYPTDVLPIECINGKGYLVDKNSSDTWLALYNTKLSDVGQLIEMTYNSANDEINATITTIAANHDAVKLRKKIVSDKDQFKKWLYGNLDIENFEIENLDENDKRLTIKASSSMGPEKSDKHIFIDPFLGLCEKKNIFKSESRDYQVDLTYKYRRSYSSKFTIPDGYKLVSLPSPIQIDNPLMQINVIVSQSESEIHTNATYLFTKSLYDAADYAKLKALFNTVVTKFNQQIVLEKIDSEN